MEKKAIAGPCTICTVKTCGRCCGGRCALHGVCPWEQALIEASVEKEPQITTGS